MIERDHEAFEEGVRLTVVGERLKPGDLAPDFELENLDPTEGILRPVTLAESIGTVRLLNIINSVDTPVCHIETKRWESSRSVYPAIQVMTVSMDLPFGLARWQTEAGVEHTMLSSHKNEQFAIDYGILLKEWRLLQRAVIVIDPNNRVVYAEYVANQMDEPNYEAAMSAASLAAESG